MAATAWSTALLSGPPPKVIPPNTVSDRSRPTPSSRACTCTAAGKQL